MSKVLLDTSVIIDFLRQKNKADTLLYKLAKSENLFVSIVTHTEIYAGKSVWEKKGAKQEVEDLFSGFTILPMITEISEIAGNLKAYNHDRSLLDCIIGATAKYHNLDLATFNSKDFKAMAGVKLLES